MRVVQVLLLLAATIFLGFHFLHLSADFPNKSPWMDWAKYTDEGWYGDAAIRHFQLGHWYVPGDFNPAVALPVWPLLEACLFLFTGVSLIAARALTVSVFGCVLIASWFLIARGNRPEQRSGSSLAASVAVFLLAVNPFCFVFTRLAIIEPLLILLTILALLAARSIRTYAPPQAGSGWKQLPREMPVALRANWPGIVALGVLLPLMVLTKTTAIFIFPAIVWMLFAAAQYRFRNFLRVSIPTAALAICLWLFYFLLVVRPHYLQDYRYLFSANSYTGMTRDNFSDAIVNTLRGFWWIGSLLYVFSFLSILFTLFRLRTLSRYPLIPCLILWAGGYTAFLAYHYNWQPRYYLVIAVPLTLVLPVIFEDLIVPLVRPPLVRGIVLATGAVIAALIAFPDARLTLRFVRSPEYTLLHAAEQVRDYILTDRQRDPSHNPLVLSISGSDLSLMTGIPSICDDFGTLELGARIQKYHPGWYLAWNQIDDDKMDAIAPLDHIERVATFPAMDDPDRNQLILYRLDPVPPTSTAPHPKPKIPKGKLGQQPSPIQLKH